MFTRMNYLGWSCDVRQSHILSFVLLTMCVRNCEGKGVCPPTLIWCGRNVCSIQRGNIWVHSTYIHKALDGVHWVTPILVLVFCGVQDPHSTCQCYEEVPMGGNPTVCNFWSALFLLGEWKLQGCVGCVEWVREDVLVSWSFYSWYCETMLLWIS